MEKMIFTATHTDKLLNLLSEKGFSYSMANKILRNKDVRVENIKTNENMVIENGTEVTVFYQPDMISQITIEKIFEDENIILINKPTGIEVEGENSLSKHLFAFAVHRLDRNTTGLVILAKNEKAKTELEKAIKNHAITKKYLAQVVGKTNFKNFQFNAFLLKDNKTSFVKIYEKPVKGAVPISTIFNTIKSSATSSIVECKLITGKTHQIRASLAYLNHPIIGDGKYGKNDDNKKFKAKTQFLHSYYLKLDGLSSSLKYLNGKEFIKMPNWFIEKEV